MDPRQRHIGKTKAEKQVYIQNILDPNTPTAETQEIKKLPYSYGDTTNEKMSEEEREFIERKRIPPLPSESKETQLRSLLYVIITIAATALIGFLGWGALKVVDLNREVGEIKIELNHMKNAKDTESKRLDSLEEKINSKTIKDTPR